MEAGPRLPSRYGRPVVRLLVRDPERLYVYWEGGTRLRLLDRTSGSVEEADVPEVGSRFLGAEPGREYEVELVHGVAVVSRSNRVRTPRRGAATRQPTSP